MFPSRKYRRWLRAPPRRIEHAQIFPRKLPAGFRDQIIDPRIGPKRQRIQIARGLKMPPGFADIGQLPPALTKLKLPIRRLRIEPGRLLKVPGGHCKVAFSFSQRTIRARLCQRRRVRCGQIGGAQRREGRTILEIHRHGAEQNVCAAAKPRPQNVRKVPLKIVIDHLPARVIGPDLVFDKHLHTTPRLRVCGFSFQLSPQRHQQLARARFLNRQAHTHKRQGRRLRPKNRRRSKRPHHFIIAHIHNPQVPFPARALAGNRHDDMRVDRGDSQIDDFKLLFRIFFPQQDLQITSRSKRRFRVAHRGRFAEDKNAVGARRFFWFHPKRRRRAGHFRWKEFQRKLVVIHEEIPPANFDLVEESKRMTVTAQAQGRLNPAQ